MTDSEQARSSLITRLDTWLHSHVHLDKVSISSRVLVLILALILTTTTVLHYIATMFAWTSAGFSLDDSWIHLEYARSIFEGRPWEYSSGVPSTGSSSPLWSILLSPLFFFTTNPGQVVVGVHLVAWVLYVGTTFLAGTIALEHSKNMLVSGLAMFGFVIVPRNTWLMLSGMEYPVFGFILLLGIWAAGKDGDIYDLVLAVAWGLSYLARPEGAVVLGVCVLARFIIRTIGSPNRLREVGLFLSKIPVAFLIALPWILHCLNVTGHFLPDSFYVKANPPTETGISVWNNWWIRWLTVHLFLSVGLIFGVYTLKTRRPFAWIGALTFIILYRFTMPYQALVNNSRYLVPAFALLMVSAVIGVSGVSHLLSSRTLPSNIPCHTGTVILVIGVVMVPSLHGYEFQAHYFGNSVKNINEMQVTIGLWLSENTRPDAVLAIVDAGAIRFFSDRPIIDLLGLVSPDMIHRNMTHSETMRYLCNHSCDYLVLFESWYNTWAVPIRHATQRLYTVNLTDNVVCAGPVMSVFSVDWSKTTYG